MVLGYKQINGSMKQIQESRDKPKHISKLILDKGIQNTQWRKTDLSINDAGMIGNLHVKE